MKKMFTYFTGFSLLAIATLSCSKDQHHETRQQATTPQVITANVPAGQTYVLNLGVGSTASIQTQAQHSQLSTITKAADGNTVYKYTAAKGYAGADQVTLQQMITYTTQESGGGCSNHHENESTTTSLKTIVVKMNVAD